MVDINEVGRHGLVNVSRLNRCLFAKAGRCTVEYQLTAQRYIFKTLPGYGDDPSGVFLDIVMNAVR